MPMSDTRQNALAAYLSELLTDAKTNRQRLEAKWIRNYAAVECDETFDSETWKPGQSAAAEEQVAKQKKRWKSRTFFDVTRQKVTVAANLIADAMFKGGRVPIMLNPETRSTMLAQMDPAAIQQAIEHHTANLHDQFKRTRAVRELGKIIRDGCTYGEMWAKSYVTDLTDRYWDMDAATMLPVRIAETTRSKSIERKSPWNIWRDLEREDPQDMEFIIEREHLNAADLLDLRDRARRNPGEAVWIEQAIQRVLDRHNRPASNNPSNDSTLPPGERFLSKRRRTLEKYECWCMVPATKAIEFERDEMGLTVAAGPADHAGAPPSEATPATETATDPATAAAPSILPADDHDDDVRLVPIVAWMCEGEIIGYRRNPGPRPYCFEWFEPPQDGVKGRSVADNLFYIQKSINGMIRSIEDNTKLIANLIVAALRNKSKNDLANIIEEGGLLELDPDEMGDADVRKAVQQIVFQDITGPLFKGLELFMAFADLASNLPRVEQGQQSENAQTAYELAQRLEKSGKYVAGVIRNLDNMVEWIGHEYYDYNVSDPDGALPPIPCAVVPLGFTSFENRFLRLQKLIQMLTTAMGDQSGEIRGITKFRWLWEEVGKAQDLEAAQYIKTVEEQQAEQDEQVARLMAEQAAQEQPAVPAAPSEPAPESPADTERKLADAQQKMATAREKNIRSAIMLRQQRQQAERNQLLMQGTLGGLHRPG